MHPLRRNSRLFKPTTSAVCRLVAARGASATVSLLLIAGTAVSSQHVLDRPVKDGEEALVAVVAPADRSTARPLSGFIPVDGALITGLKVQAAAQQRAADTERLRKQEAERVARRRAAAKERADRKAAADRAERSARAERARKAKQREALWVPPVTHFHLGASYGLGGRLWARNHSGQDFVVPGGTAVNAVHNGTIVEAGWGGAYGWNIVIRHSSGVYTQYAHLSRLGVHVGQRVGTGQQIGRSGSTGNSTGPHLHFEVRTAPWYGSSIAPLTFLRSKRVRI